MGDDNVFSGFNCTPRYDKMLNVLCLDGGGVRGLSELLILRDIMMSLQRRSKSKEVPLPCEVFDLICGTSTGGIIALMLGRLRMSTEEAIDAYIDFSRTVFGKKWTVKSLLSPDILEGYREHDRIGRVRRLDFGGMGSKDGRRSRK